MFKQFDLWFQSFLEKKMIKLDEKIPWTVKFALKMGLVNNETILNKVKERLAKKMAK